MSVVRIHARRTDRSAARRHPLEKSFVARVIPDVVQIRVLAHPIGVGRTGLERSLDRIGIRGSDLPISVSRGGWLADGEWVPIAFVDEHSAELLFRHKVIRFLRDEGLLSEERTELLLSWRHSGFSVQNRVRVEPEDQASVERLGRYIMRPPISLERMSWDGVGEVRYRLKGGHS